MRTLTYQGTKYRVDIDRPLEGLEMTAHFTNEAKLRVRVARVLFGLAVRVAGGRFKGVSIDDTRPR